MRFVYLLNLSGIYLKLISLSLGYTLFSRLFTFTKGLGLMQRISIRDIARETGFSPATVSNVLNNKGSVSAKTKESVRETAMRLGYLKSGQLKSIEFVLARASGRIVDNAPFHPAILESATEAASRYSLKTSLSFINLSYRNEARRQANALAQDPSRGILLLATEMMDDDDYALFEDFPVPLVAVDGWSDKIPLDCVVIENEASAYRATTHLVENGHERIGYIGCSIRIRNMPLRERGFRHVLEDVGLPFDESLRVMVGPTAVSAYADMRKWLDTKPDLPTAFFADNDVAAAASIRALSDAGVSVPDDVSIVGFDDQDVCKLVQPPLTTMRVPRKRMGELAVRALVDQSSNPDHVPCITQVHTTLVERQSVRPIAS